MPPNPNNQILTKRNLSSLFLSLAVLAGALLNASGRQEESRSTETVRRPAFPESVRTTSLPAAASFQAAFSGDSYGNGAELRVGDSRSYLMEPPTLRAQSIYIKDLTANAELYGANTAAAWPIASITKLMTAVVALEKMGPARIITISPNAIATEGGAGGFQAGERYNVNDLIKAMLFVSSNDAAIAIAESYGTSAFVDAMQTTASDLGMSATAFFDASGLSFMNQSVPHDLEKLITYIRQEHPELLSMTMHTSTYITERASNAARELVNINAFAGQADFRGGKTGFIDSSKGNLISTFEHKGHTILIIVFGAEDRFGQTAAFYNWIRHAFIF